MTFATLKSRVMARLKLTSAEADTRVGSYLNERYRSVATSIGLTPVRWGSTTFPTVASTKSYSPSTVIHALSLQIPAENRLLVEQTMDFIRTIDPDDSQEGVPQYYVRTNYGATTTTLRLWPTPDAAYTVNVDGILAGTDMTAAGDIPVMPEDFHDALIFGAVADELLKLDKDALSASFEKRFEKRVRDLRYFIAKTAYLNLRQGENGNWWWGHWYGNYGWRL